jgi:hypothetical protein
VTRDFSICLGHSFLILRQNATKLWSFYSLIMPNYWLKYQSQKTCLSCERGKISSICDARFSMRKVWREIINHIKCSNQVKLKVVPHNTYMYGHSL